MSIHRIFKGLGAALLLFSCLAAHAAAPDPSAAADAWMGRIRLPAKNYVNDGSFESGGQDWTWFVHQAGGIDNEEAAHGEASFRMGVNDPNRNFYYYQYSIPLETGKTYTFSAMVKTQGITEELRESGAIILTNYAWTSQSVPLQAPATTTGWTRGSKPFVAPETKARPDGKPAYNLVIHWPPNNPGRIWIDDVQIEEGPRATGYSDRYVGDGVVALEQLKALAQDLFAATDALAAFPPSATVDNLGVRLEDIRQEAQTIRDDLKSYGKLSAEQRQSLAPRIADIAGRLARIRTLMWTGPAHLPLSDVNLPDAPPDAMNLTLTCLRGEHRDVALNVVPLESVGYALKLTPSALYNRQLALSVPGSQWLDAYTVPQMRGYQKTDKLFTDPLPRLNDAGICQIQPGRINQVILSVDTSDLPPGDYEATIAVDALHDADSRRTINVTLTVLPEALMPITNARILECFGHTQYAWQAMIDLGVNTFDIYTDWIDVSFDESGNLLHADFTRIDRDAYRARDAVPDAQFLFLSAHGMWKKISFLTGWQEDDPRFEQAFKQWIRAIVDHFASLEVGADRLVMETYDEPQPGDYAAGTTMAHWIEQTEPAVWTQFYGSGIVEDPAWTANARAHDIIGPIVSACTPENMRFVADLGKILWTYDCQADGESFHPIAYYRLMPWMSRKYNLTGWGHFSWFDTSHDRPYRAWEGIEAQNLVYPTADGRGMVISRRYLAIRAGQEDYRVFDALQRLAERTQSTTDIEPFVNGAYDRALRLAPRERGYQTHITGDLPADLLDTLRQQAVDRAAAMMPESNQLAASLAEEPGATSVSVDVPEAGTLRIRYLVDGRLPWRTMRQAVAAGPVAVALPEATGRVNRCLVEVVGDGGRIWSGSATIIPQITVDSTSPPYDAQNLNDGIRVPAVKFEPESAWISDAASGEHWVEMDLGPQREVSEVRLDWMTYTSLPRKVGLRYLDDDGDWQPVPELPQWRSTTDAVETIAFPKLKTSKLRIVQAPLGGGVGAPALMGLGEVEVK